MKIKKGDNIVVIAGKDRGKSGTVLRAFPQKNTVLIEGVNVVKRHQRASRRGRSGQIIERPTPVHVSNVAIATKDGAASRVGYIVEEGKKVRVAKKNGEKI